MVTLNKNGNENMLGNLKERFLSYFNKNLGSSQRYTAFTLAEVLIVLAIIGVVAALTIPTLITKTRNQEYLTALKKSYSAFNQGFASILATEGVSTLGETSVFQSIPTQTFYIREAEDSSVAPFWPNLKKYFKFEIVQAPSGYIAFDLGGNQNSDYSGKDVLAFSDGSVIYDGQIFKQTSNSNADTPAKIQTIHDNGGHMYGYNGNIWIDVNGFKKPNIRGRDMFGFYIGGNGMLYPINGIDENWYLNGQLGNDYWLNNHIWCSGTDNSISGVSGQGCAARIIESGWKMDY